MFLPSDDQTGPSASVERLVMALGVPVMEPTLESKARTQALRPPAMPPAKEEAFSTGAHLGPDSPAWSAINWCGSPPAADMAHRWLVFLFSCRLTSTAANKTHLPSG